MLSRRALATAVRSARPSLRPAPRAPFSLTAAPRAAVEHDDDPNMNGGYINPPAIKRSKRDPYGDWDDKQERRNFGEPVHEDNDILGIFSLHDYTHMTPARALLCWAVFIGGVSTIFYTVKANLPDKPSYPKEYEGGLDRELGGAGAVRAFASGDAYNR
ncbi:hypothetical protein DV738_g1248, partial [Chaetothyriales sp. CBS 135597]